MGLKFSVEKLDGLDDSIKAMYKPAQSGQGFVLDVEGVVEKTKLDEFRENNVKLLKQLEAFKGVDPEKIKELQETERKLKEKELIDKGDLDGLIGQRVALMKEEYENKIKQLAHDNSISKKQLETLLVDNKVREASTSGGVLSTAIDDVILRAKTLFSVEKGDVVAKKDGKMVYGKDGTTTLSINEWIQSLKDTAPHLFAQNQGAGASGGFGTKGFGDASKMTTIQKVQAGLKGRF